MAIRARIKTKIKSLLFGSSSNKTENVNSNNAAQTSTVTKSTFVAPEVSTTATNDGSESKDSAPSVEEVTKSVAPSPSPNEKTIAANTEDTETKENGVPTPEKELTEADENEATFVFDIEELFPAECPHCGASSNNNWIRIENKFACGSCEAAY